MYEFRTTLWEHDGDAAWFFVTLPEDVSDEIEWRTADGRTGFGSVRAEVTIGATTWRTSLFPDTKRGAYVLPIKKAVRTAESIDDGDEVDVTVQLVEA